MSWYDFMFEEKPQTHVIGDTWPPPPQKLLGRPKFMDEDDLNHNKPPLHENDNDKGFLAPGGDEKLLGKDKPGKSVLDELDPHSNPFHGMY